MKKNKLRVLAFYLPQFHPTLDNDEWWGKGFTEWTNVGKAKSLFWGHYQPRVPADLGYYDLRLPEVREAQAKLAQEAGIEGFCYYHYWFGSGKKELDYPFSEVLKLGKPDFPFCLCWANESWHSKFWNKDGGFSSKLLIEQKYYGKQDYIDHFYDVLPAFLDKRYIRVDGNPLFLIYKPLQFPDIDNFMKIWKELAIQNGLSGIHFCAHTSAEDELITLKKMRFDSINIVRLWDCMKKRSIIKKIVGKIVRRMIYPHPFVISYNKAVKYFIGSEASEEKIYPTIIPNWDHSPRSGNNGFVITKSTPDFFKEHASKMFDIVNDKQDKIVFLKSWNEWGEGNYMEPDLRFGKGYITALREAIDKY